MYRTVGFIAGGAALVLALVAAFFGYQYYAVTDELRSTRSSIASIEEEARATEALLTERLDEKTEEAITLAGELRREQQKTGNFERQISDLAGSVGTLEKLAATDAELLAKYSKVYFLNENYVPSKLSAIPKDFTLQPDRVYDVHGDMKPYLLDLLEDATKDGLSLLVVSAFRSFDTQSALKAGYQVRYGSGANAFSADQGYSEHQLGTAVDFTTPTVGGTFVGFDKTEEYEWLTDNAWRYGFILSYPAGNAYYQYEPWHWRFVGRALAKDLRDDDMAFYDLDQRTIDTYLVDLFD